MTSLLILFAILNALDGWTTWHVLRFGGYEANNAIAWLMLHLGRYNALLLIKVLPVALVWWLDFKYGIDQKIMIGICAGYAGLICSNYYQLMKQKGVIK